MAILNTYDLKDDFNGSFSTAADWLERRGFKIVSDHVEIYDEVIKYFEENNINYGIISDKKEPLIFAKKEDNKAIEWVNGCWSSNLIFKKLSSPSFLYTFNRHTQSKFRLTKHGNEKIRKVYQKVYYDLPSNSISFLNTGLADLVHLILHSYFNCGFEIKSVKDFLKLIEISPSRESIRIKFFDEGQAAEFAMLYHSQ